MDPFWEEIPEEIGHFGMSPSEKGGTGSYVMKKNRADWLPPNFFVGQ